jgi:hypothetical protein
VLLGEIRIIRCLAAMFAVLLKLLPANLCPHLPSLALPQEAAAGEAPALGMLLEPLQEVCRAHADGKGEYARTLCTRLLGAFLEVEEQFEAGGKSTEQEVIDSLRQVRYGQGGGWWGWTAAFGVLWERAREGWFFFPQHADADCSTAPYASCCPLLPLQVHSGKLQAVLDIVLSHQGAPLKSALMQRLMSALVLPAPEHYRALLRRLAGLAEPSAAEVAQRAQQLLEHSLLGELRTLVARALSGLDLFAEPQFRELFGGATSPVGKASQLCVCLGEG